ncbi:hypothetical protein KVQ64_002074 [Vibrio vulnificus]|nr:hypothetical protein [Vibrio vulnificus]
MGDTLETKYEWSGYDEFEPILPAPKYRVVKSQTKAFETIKQTNGLTTVVRLESGELHTFKGRGEVIGVYDPSITQQQFRSDIS